jgi:hypothetical protein
VARATRANTFAFEEAEVRTHRGGSDRALILGRSSVSSLISSSQQISCFRVSRAHLSNCTRARPPKCKWDSWSTESEIVQLWKSRVGKRFFYLGQITVQLHTQWGFEEMLIRGTAFSASQSMFIRMRTSVFEAARSLSLSHTSVKSHIFKNQFKHWHLFSKRTTFQRFTSYLTRSQKA